MKHAQQRVLNAVPDERNTPSPQHADPPRHRLVNLIRHRKALMIVGTLVMLTIGAVVVLTLTNGFDNVTTQHVGGASPRTVPVHLVDTAFGFDATPDVITVDRGAHLILEVVNDGNEKHDLALGGGALRTRMLDPGDSQRLDLGTITHDIKAWCTLPGHKFLGMMLEIRMSQAPQASAGP